MPSLRNKPIRIHTKPTPISPQATVKQAVSYKPRGRKSSSLCEHSSLSGDKCQGNAWRVSCDTRRYRHPNWCCTTRAGQGIYGDVSRRDACQNPYPILLNNSSITSGFAMLLQMTTDPMLSEQLFDNRRMTCSLDVGMVLLSQNRSMNGCLVTRMHE